jgi:hypothetical protein
MLKSHNFVLLTCNLLSLVHMILVSVAYYERTQAKSSTSRSNYERNEGDIAGDEEEGLLFSE